MQQILRLLQLNLFEKRDMMSFMADEVDRNNSQGYNGLITRSNGGCIVRVNGVVGIEPQVIVLHREVGHIV